MFLTDAEHIEVFSILEDCGIKGSDAATSFGHVCKIAGDTSYPKFLNHVKTMTLEQMGDTFGQDAIRAVRCLQVYA